jgi:hypothetical protein
LLAIRHAGAALAMRLEVDYARSIGGLVAIHIQAQFQPSLPCYYNLEQCNQIMGTFMGRFKHYI